MVKNRRTDEWKKASLCGNGGHGSLKLGDVRGLRANQEDVSRGGVKRVREIGTLVWISRNHYLLLIASPIELQ